MPPVFGPVSPSSSRLWSRAGGSGDGRRAVADGDDARLAARRAAPRRRPAAAGRAAPADESASGVDRLVRSAASHTVTPLPAARPSALTTTPPRRARAPGERDRRGRVVERAAPGPSRTPAAAATSRQNALLASIRAAAAVGPKTAIRPRQARRRRRPPAAPRARRRPGPPPRAGRARRPPPVERSTSGTHGPAARARSRRCPGATMTSLTPGSRGQLPGQRVLAAAAADDRIRVGMTRLTPRPAARAGGASAARPARSSGSAPDRPTRARSAPPRAPRGGRRSAGRPPAGRPARGRRRSARPSRGSPRRSASRATAPRRSTAISTRRPSSS